MSGLTKLLNGLKLGLGAYTAYSILSLFTPNSHLPYSPIFTVKSGHGVVATKFTGEKVPIIDDGLYCGFFMRNVEDHQTKKRLIEFSALDDLIYSKGSDTLKNRGLFSNDNVPLDAKWSIVFSVYDLGKYAIETGYDRDKILASVVNDVAISSIQSKASNDLFSKKEELQKKIYDAITGKSTTGRSILGQYGVRLDDFRITQLRPTPELMSKYEEAKGIERYAEAKKMVGEGYSQMIENIADGIREKFPAISEEELFARTMDSVDKAIAFNAVEKTGAFVYFSDGDNKPNLVVPDPQAYYKAQQDKKIKEEAARKNAKPVTQLQ